MKGRNYVIGIGVLIVALFVIFGAGVWHVHQLGKLYSGKPLPVDSTKTLSGISLRDISVSVDGAMVHLHPASGSNATVHAYGTVETPSLKNLTFTADEKAGKLNVVLEQNNNAERGKENLTLDIFVPKQEYNSILVQSGSGQVQVSDLTAAKTDLEISGANASAANMVTNLTVNVGSGAVLADHVSGNLDLQTGQGNITVHQKSFSHDVNATVDAGSIAINVESPPKNVKFQLTTKIGNLKSNLPAQKFIRSEPGNVVGYVGTGGPIVEASSNDGDVSLTFAK